MHRPTLLLFFCASSVLSAACGSAPDAPASDLEHAEQAWDSADGNFTHPTHSYLAEAAIDSVRKEIAEVEQYKKDIVKGANLELHELPLKKGDDANDEYEPLRVEIGGTNWAADRPGILWDKARALYAAGNKREAYVMVGILMHYVQDMGVPAHAFHVVHQSTLGKTDHFEVLAFQKWCPSYEHVDRADPELADPVAYIAWSGEWAAEEFKRAYPSATYERHFFGTDWTKLEDKDVAFVKERQGHVALANTWALRAAAKALTQMGVSKAVGEPEKQAPLP